MKKHIKIVPHRRKREGDTDYRRRLKLLKSEKLRLVVRKYNRNTIAQLVEYHEGGDKVLATVSTRALLKYNWKHSRSNIPAAYLLGLLLAKKANEKNCKEAILDLGLHTSTKGSRLYAVLKGAVDGGLKIPHDKEILPNNERLTGMHTKNKEEISKSVSQIREKIMKG